VARDASLALSMTGRFLNVIIQIWCQSMFLGDSVTICQAVFRIKNILFRPMEHFDAAQLAF
jgi:hypothetical protein